MLCRPTGGDNCVTRILRGKARAPNDQDVVDPELGPAACCHVQGGNIPHCGGVVEEVGGWLPGGEVRVSHTRELWDTDRGGVTQLALSIKYYNTISGLHRLLFRYTATGRHKSVFTWLSRLRILLCCHSSLDAADHLRLHSVDKLDFAHPGVDLPAGDSSEARGYGSTAGDVWICACILACRLYVVRHGTHRVCLRSDKQRMRGKVI